MANGIPSLGSSRQRKAKFFLLDNSEWLHGKGRTYGEVHNSHKLAPTPPLSHLFQYFQTLSLKPFPGVSLLSLFLITEFLYAHHQPLISWSLVKLQEQPISQPCKRINLLPLPASSPGTLMVPKENGDLFPAPPFPLLPRGSADVGISEQQLEDSCTLGCWHLMIFLEPVCKENHGKRKSCLFGGVTWGLYIY